MVKQRAAGKAAEQSFAFVPKKQQEKKPFLENRAAAIALCAAAVLLGLLLGTHRSVARQARAVEAGFTDGIQYEGYSIMGDLTDRMEYATNLTKIAARYNLNRESDAVADAVAQMYGQTSPKLLYQANVQLSGAVEALNGALLQAGLSDRDESYRMEYYRNFVSCNDTISHEAVLYNQKVDRFHQKILHAFPTGTLAKLTGVREVEAFR